MIQDTSLQAFEEIRSELGKRQEQVYNTLRSGPLTNFMIARKLKLPINSITPRVKELREKKLVGVAFIDVDLFTGRNAIYWKVVR